MQTPLGFLDERAGGADARDGMRHEAVQTGVKLGGGLSMDDFDD